MAALRLPIEGTDHLQFVPAAGVPWFVALFGRDSLIVSLQNAMVYPDFARGALEVLARAAGEGARRLPRRRARQDHARAAPRRAGALQAHSAHALLRHRGRDAALPDRPAQRLALHRRSRAARAASGDGGACLAWIDNYGDRDGDGFQEYQTRSAGGYENQGWKDAGEAVVVYPTARW